VRSASSRRISLHSFTMADTVRGIVWSTPLNPRPHKRRISYVSLYARNSALILIKLRASNSDELIWLKHLSYLFFYSVALEWEVFLAKNFALASQKYFFLRKKLINLARDERSELFERYRIKKMAKFDVLTFLARFV
jgi:hypothetical protein